MGVCTQSRPLACPPSDTPTVGMRSLVLCWLAALPGLAALQLSQPLSPAASARLATRRHPGIALALSDEHGMQVRIDSYEEEEEAEVSAEDPCMLLVHMQSPADTGALFWSEVLMESGAWCVSLSDGAFGTEEEEPIYSVHAPGSVAPELETWGQLLEARHFWSNTSIEVGFPVGTDVEATLLLAAASAGLDAPPRFRIENLVATDWVSEVQANWAPIVIPGSLLIRFPWHPPAAEIAAERGVSPSLPALTLQPGMAFGTGEHPTTQLCCEAVRAALARPELRGCDVLDYGSGSGVLAFAALLFGAANAVGVEIPNPVPITNPNPSPSPNPNPNPNPNANPNPNPTPNLYPTPDQAQLPPAKREPSEAATEAELQVRLRLRARGRVRARARVSLPP